MATVDIRELSNIYRAQGATPENQQLLDSLIRDVLGTAPITLNPEKDQIFREEMVNLLGTITTLLPLVKDGPTRFSFLSDLAEARNYSLVRWTAQAKEVITLSTLIISEQ